MRPTKPGWYWWKGGGLKSEWEAVRVVAVKASWGFEFFCVGDEDSDRVDVEPGEFRGPIEPPRE